jgi:hypothetical protein
VDRETRILISLVLIFLIFFIIPSIVGFLIIDWLTRIHPLAYLLLGLITIAAYLSMKEFRDAFREALTAFTEVTGSSPIDSAMRLLPYFLIPFIFVFFMLLAPILLPLALGLWGLKAAFPLIRHIATTHMEEKDKTKVLDRDLRTLFSLLHLLQWIINKRRLRKEQTKIYQ